MFTNENQEQSQEKIFNITFEQDGVYLCVRKALPTEKSVSIDDILDCVKRKKIKNFEVDTIANIVKQADSTKVKIAPFQESQKVNAEVNVSFSDDKLAAYIIISEPEGNGDDISKDAILSALKRNNVVYGINEDAIGSIVEYPLYRQKIKIAEGYAPVNGKNGEIVFQVEVAKQKKPTILEDGRVDYRDLNIIENVTKGQKLCDLIPPTKGTSGKNVFGKEIKALDGKPAQPRLGRNVYLSDSADSVLAEIDGQLMYIDGKISIISTFEVHDNVDNSTGNIKFVGNVTIKGNVLSGFIVEAGGNVEVEGIVEGATIKAEGDIILKRGMNGNGKGQLIAGGDIIAKYIENGILEAKNDIKSEAIMHSKVKCGNRLELGGRRGLLVGGEIKVGREINCMFIGNNLATATILEVGIDPHLRERLKFLKNEVISINSNLTKTNQAITLLKKLEQAGALNEDKRQMLVKSVRSKVFFDTKLSEYKSEIEKIENLQKDSNNGIVTVKNTIFSGTRVSIGSALMYVKENLSHCTLYSDGADVRVGPL